MWDLCRISVGIMLGFVPCNDISGLLSYKQNTGFNTMKQTNQMRIEIINNGDLNTLSKSEQRLFYITLLTRILELHKQNLINNKE